MNLTENVRKLNVLRSLALIPLTLIAMSTARAQTAPVDIAHRFNGYEPTVLESDAKAAEIFKGMETRFSMIRPWKLQFGSECTQRAETWTYDLDKSRNIKAEKVFVFYTIAYHAYHREVEGKKFGWWFHVAPLVLVKNATGQVEERVMDPAFADAPQAMKDWTDIFIKSKKPCIENVRFSEFEGDVTGEGKSYDKSAHCYIVRAPMYDLFPEHADEREKGHKSSLEWDLNEVRYGAKALLPRARKEFLARVGL
jgi:hypothetical protein